MLNKMQMIMIPIFLLVPVLLVHNYSGRIRAVWWFLGVADTNDVIQKIEKTLNNTHTTTQQWWCSLEKTRDKIK